MARSLSAYFTYFVAVLALKVFPQMIMGTQRSMKNSAKQEQRMNVFRMPSDATMGWKANMMTVANPLRMIVTPTKAPPNIWIG